MFRPKSPSAARYLRPRDLILLCANHHAEVDAQPETYTVDALRAWKAEHESFVESVTSNVRVVNDALGGQNLVESRVELQTNPDVDGWEDAAAREWRDASVAIAETPAGRRRFAVFSLGRIPLAVQLGYVLGDRVRAELFHYHRDRASWSWEGAGEPSGTVSWTVHDSDQVPLGEAAVRVSLSAAILLARDYGEALAALRERGSRRIHLYYAGPAAGAVVFGRGYTPRMNPEVVVYEYRRAKAPAYEQALVLNR